MVLSKYRTCIDIDIILVMVMVMIDGHSRSSKDA